MSKGRPMFGLRVDEETAAAIAIAVASQNRLSDGEALDLSGWLRRAVQRELDHRQRSNTWRPGRTWPGLRRMLRAAARVPEGSDYGG